MISKMQVELTIALLKTFFIVTLLGGVVYFSYDKGYKEAVQDRKNKDTAELSRLQAKADKKEADLLKKLEDKDDELYNQKVHYEKIVDGVVADAMRGNSGMRAKGTCLRPNPAPASAAPAAAPQAEEGYVLMPETAANVLHAAINHRNDVLDYNDLLERYELMRDTCNGKL